VKRKRKKGRECERKRKKEERSGKIEVKRVRWAKLKAYGFLEE
jgi:hypothetical protein